MSLLHKHVCHGCTKMYVKSYCLPVFSPPKIVRTVMTVIRTAHYYLFSTISGKRIWDIFKIDIKLVSYHYKIFLKCII